MATSAKSIARKATVVAAAALGAAQMVAAPAADASSIGGIFLYRQFANISANCLGGTHYISNKGAVNLGYYLIWQTRYQYTSYNGNFQTSRYEDWASTKADKQLWCYGDNYYYEYFAYNAFHRYRSIHFYCSSIGCAYLGTHNGSWIGGV